MIEPNLPRLPDGERVSRVGIAGRSTRCRGRTERGAGNQLVSRAPGIGLSRGQRDNITDILLGSTARRANSGDRPVESGIRLGGCVQELGPLVPSIGVDEYHTTVGRL